jgi:MFS family permease
MNNSDFRSLWLGQFASTLGTWLLVVGVPLHIFDITGSTALTGAAFVAETLPALLFGPAAGVLVDRLDRRRVMIATDIVRASAILSMLLARDPDHLWIIYVAILVENGAAQLFRPARQALIPALVGDQSRLPAANSMFGMIDGLVRLFGSVLGGAIYAVFGFSTLVVADSASYLLSAVGVYMIRHRSVRLPRPPVTLTGGIAELQAGLRHVWGHRLLRGLIVVTAIFYLANGALTALLVPFARTQLHLDTHRYGYLLAALGVGYLFGSPLARWLIDRWSTRIAVLVSVPWLAVCFGLAFGSRVYPLAVAAFALAGAPAVVLIVAVATAYQRHTPDRLLGRVTAAFLTVEMAVYVAGAGLASSVAEESGVMPVVTASIVLLGALVALLPQLLPRSEAPAGPPSSDGATPVQKPRRPLADSDRPGPHGLARTFSAVAEPGIRRA